MRWLLLPCLALAAAAAEDLEGTCKADGSCKTGRRHHWPSARGHLGSYSTTKERLPLNLSSVHRWTWFHPDGQYHTVALGCVIDDGGNVYAATHDGIAKLDPDGKLLWAYKAHTVPTVPFLHEDLLIGSGYDGFVFALSLESGRERWARKVAGEIAGDTGFVTGHDGVVIAAADSVGGERNRRVVALRAESGEQLWTYAADAGVWNFMALFPDDGSLVFQDLEGKAYRLSLADGSLIWKKGGNPGTWSDGTLMLGQSGAVYAVTTHGPLEKCALMIPDRSFCTGAVLAYALKDGAELWRRNFSLPANAFLAVGKLREAEGEVVIAPIGQQATFEARMQRMLVAAFMLVPGLWAALLCGLAAGCCGPCRGRRCCLRFVKGAFLGFALGFGVPTALGVVATFTPPSYASALVALDAESGETLWQYDLPVYEEWHTSGDPEGFATRKALGTRNLCLPNPFSAPTIAADGAVHVGYQDGRLYSVRDVNGDGKIDPDTEVSTFATGTAFSSPGAAYAPGRVVVANCDGVFAFGA